MAVSYPTVMFVSGGTTVTLPAPTGGGSFDKMRSQAIGRTASGTLVAYDKDAKWTEATLNFTHLSSTNKSDLESFIDTVAGATWTYTNSAGTSYTAQFINTRLLFRQLARGAYGLTVRLSLGTTGGE